MKIEELLEKKEKVFVQMLRKLILSGGSYKASDLREYVGISKSAFDQYCEELMDLAGQMDGCFELSFSGNELVFQLNQPASLDKIICYLLVESPKYQLLDYLFIKKELNVQMLTNYLSMSDSTVFRKIKELNNLLKEYDLKIKNGRLIGEELQIRYLYFELFLFVQPHHRLAYFEETSLANQFIRGMERLLQVTFDKKSRQHLFTYFVISQKRLSVKKPSHKELLKKLPLFHEDELYKKINQFVAIYMARTTAEISKYEGLMYYIFITTFYILGEDGFYQYELTRSKKLPTPRVDIYVREAILFHYRPLRIPIATEKKIVYQIAQTNSRLYFFKGQIERIDYENLLKYLIVDEGMNELIERLEIFVREHLRVVLKENDSLARATRIDFASIINIISSEVTKQLDIGLNINVSSLLNQPLQQLLTEDLSSIVGINVSLYDPEKSYDLIITAVEETGERIKNTDLYVLSEFYSSYDSKQLRKKIEAIRKEKNVRAR